MKKQITKILSKLFLLSILFMTISCYVPSPLYGTWSDNTGNKIIFQDDGSFTAKIVTSKNEKNEPVFTNYQGTYNVVDNVIVFSMNPDFNRISEWDLYGSTLYLKWTTDDQNLILLTLYHTAR